MEKRGARRRGRALKKGVVAEQIAIRELKIIPNIAQRLLSHEERIDRLREAGPADLVSGVLYKPRSSVGTGRNHLRLARCRWDWILRDRSCCGYLPKVVPVIFGEPELSARA